LGHLNRIEVKRRHSPFQKVSGVRTKTRECAKFGNRQAIVPGDALDFAFGAALQVV
jgi:hypothetical protein